jgi:hypothetical protein
VLHPEPIAPVAEVLSAEEVELAENEREGTLGYSDGSVLLQ